MERTPSQTVGPYLHIGLSQMFSPLLVEPGTPGAITVHGVLLDGAGDPVPDGLIETWQAGPDGRYDGAFRGLARSDTRVAGAWSVTTLKPGRVAGPPGSGSALQTPHLAVGVFARGLLKRALTRLYFSDEEEANAEDPILSRIEPARRATLVAQAEGDGSYRFDIRLQGDEQTTFFLL